MNERLPGNPAAWIYARDALHADVLLAQEAVIPEGARAAFRPSGIAGRDGKARRWSSGVVALSDDVELEPIGLAEGVWRGRGLGVAPIDSVSRGHVAVARVHTPRLEFTAISAYGLIEFGYASGTLLRTIADLEPLLDDPRLGDHVVLGGDWNIGTWWGERDSKFAKREGAALALLAAYGLVDCLDRFVEDTRGRLANCPCTLDTACRHIETFRKPGSTSAFMDDYLFATPELAESLEYAGVHPDWAWDSELSDHAPLVAGTP